MMHPITRLCRAAVKLEMIFLKELAQSMSE